MGRLRRRSRRLTPLAALVLAVLAGGCSFRLNSLTASEPERVDQTGSVGSVSAQPPPAAAKRVLPPSEIDLAYARAAASEALARGGKDTSIPWENPHTGARGNVTPLASSYTQGGFTCRDFLASYVRDGSEAWLQGEACRMRRGQWEVRTLKPWKQT
jgi:hypothetical protein